MAIKVFGDKVVFPDNTEQTTAAKNIWTDNGGTTRFLGNGNTVATQVWAENSGKSAKVIQKGNGLSYFIGDGQTLLGTEADEVVKIITNDTPQMAFSSIGINAFQDITAPYFIGDGSRLTNVAGSGGIPEAPETGLQYGRQDGNWTPTVDA